MSDLLERCYPEAAMGGFTHCDGTVAFYIRVQALLTPESRVLELGCGRGAQSDDPCLYRRNLRIFKGRAKHVLGIDVDREAAVNPYIDEFRLIENTDHWPVEDHSVDLIVCDYVVEHIQNPESFFREARRVLAPGGYLCIRTVNAWSYIAILSRMIPNALHRKVLKVAQSDRHSEDVFPTVYRANTRRRLRNLLRQQGFKPAVYTVEPEPSYFSFSRILYRVAVFFHARMPRFCRSTLLAYARVPTQ